MFLKKMDCIIIHLINVPRVFLRIYRIYFMGMFLNLHPRSEHDDDQHLELIEARNSPREAVETSWPHSSSKIWILGLTELNQSLLGLLGILTFNFGYMWLNPERLNSQAFTNWSKISLYMASKSQTRSVPAGSCWLYPAHRISSSSG